MEEYIEIIKLFIKECNDDLDNEICLKCNGMTKIAIENILNELERLQKANEDLSITCKEQAELIENTYINYNDLEFTRLKRRNKELEKEVEEWQRAYQEEKDTQFNMLIHNKCGHCGNDTPIYCEKCQQELIAKNAELQSDNYEIKNTYRRVAQHLNNIGKTELADYMLAQINDVPVWCVGDDKNFIPKQVIKDKIEFYKECIKECHPASDCMLIELYENYIEGYEKLLEE